MFLLANCSNKNNKKIRYKTARNQTFSVAKLQQNLGRTDNLKDINQGRGCEIIHWTSTDIYWDTSRQHRTDQLANQVEKKKNQDVAEIEQWLMTKVEPASRRSSWSVTVNWSYTSKTHVKVWAITVPATVHVTASCPQSSSTRTSAERPSESSLIVSSLTLNVWQH